MVKKYPKQAKDCEQEFLSDDGEWELLCGKSNVYGEFHLCPKCRILPENECFIGGEE